MTAAAFQAIHDTCRDGGFDFDLALRTALRDGEPWYVPVRSS
jgi:hypothetical protein